MKLDPDQIARLSALQQLSQRDILACLYEHTQAFVIVADASDYRIVAANSQVQRLLGRSMRNLQQRTIFEILPQISPARLRKLLKSIRRRRHGVSNCRLRIALDDDLIVRVNLSYMPGSPDSYIVQATDITYQMQTLERADRAQSQMLTAIGALSDGFVLYDHDDRMVICNQTYRDLYPKSAYRMVPGTSFRDILQAGLDAGEYVDAIGREDAWLEERLSKHRSLDQSIEQHLTSGRWLQIVERATDCGGRVGLRVDITKLKEQQQRLHQMTITDELTGLRNRRNIAEDIAQLVRDLPAGCGLGLFHIDLHRFKIINSAYGYDNGDAILQRCADIVRSAAKSDGLAARIGGNEFLVAAQIEPAEQDVIPFANKLIEKIAAPVTVAHQQISLGASIGIAVHDQGALSQDSLLEAAELALYDAKSHNTGISVFRPSLKARATVENDLTRDLQRALRDGEFEAHFQPQIDASRNLCIGFETLMRWQHPTRGLLPAGLFLDVAQRAGLTTELDELAMDQACAALKQLERIGCGHMTVSINLSVDQLGDPRLKDRLKTALRRHGAPLEKLRLELLESTLLDENTLNFLRTTDELVAAGFHIELDDFGTGHAAIASLRKFKVSRIKIDRSFVRDIDRDKELQALTGAIVGLAQKLGIEALAEGVETPEEQAFLIDIGCTTSQGWLYSKAIPAEELPVFLKNFSTRSPIKFASRSGHSPDEGSSVSPVDRSSCH